MCRRGYHRYIFDALAFLVMAVGLVWLLLLPHDVDVYRCPSAARENCYFCDTLNLSDTTWVRRNCRSSINSSVAIGMQPCCCGSSKNTAKNKRCPSLCAEITLNRAFAFFLTFGGSAALVIMILFEIFFYVGCIPGAEGRGDVRRRVRALRANLDVKHEE
jgi:hypothetical protein